MQEGAATQHTTALWGGLAIRGGVDGVRGCGAEKPRAGQAAPDAQVPQQGIVFAIVGNATADASAKGRGFGGTSPCPLDPLCSVLYPVGKRVPVQDDG